MINFTAIDFETCGRKHASACAVALTPVVNGEIQRTFYTLLKPPPQRQWYYTEVHGITQDMTRDAPEFPDIWPNMLETIQGDLLVAHNIDFDWAALKGTLSHWHSLGNSITIS